MKLERRPVAPARVDTELTGHPHRLKSLIAETARLEPSRSLDLANGLEQGRLLARPRMKAGEEEQLHGGSPPLITVAPTPAWRLPREPADGEERHREQQGINDVDDAPLGRVDERNATDDQRQIREENDPALPRRGRAPAPAIALGREPVLWSAAQSHSDSSTVTPSGPARKTSLRLWK